MAKKTPPKPEQIDESGTNPEECDRFLYGDTALANHYGVSTKTIQNWRGKGMPCEPHRHGYKYDLEDTDGWQAAYRDDVDDLDDDEVRKETRKATLRLETAKAEKLERENQIENKNILRRDEWELFAIELIQQARDELINLPNHCKRHLCGDCKKKVPIELERIVDKILGNLGRVKDGPPEE